MTLRQKIGEALKRTREWAQGQDVDFPGEYGDWLKKRAIALAISRKQKRVYKYNKRSNGISKTKYRRKAPIYFVFRHVLNRMIKDNIVLKQWSKEKNEYLYSLK